MNKLLKLSLVFLLMIGSVGCSSSPSSDSEKKNEDTVEKDNDKQEDNNEQEEQVSIYKTGDTITIDDFEITLDSLEYLKVIDINDYYHYEADEGNQYLIITVTAKNIGSNAKTFLPMFAWTDDLSVSVHYDEEYQFHGSTLISYDNTIESEVINPLSSKTGDIIYTIPQEAIEATDVPLVLRFKLGKEVAEFSLR